MGNAGYGVFIGVAGGGLRSSSVSASRRSRRCTASWCRSFCSAFSLVDGLVPSGESPSFQSSVGSWSDLVEVSDVPSQPPVVISVTRMVSAVRSLSVTCCGCADRSLPLCGPGPRGRGRRHREALGCQGGRRWTAHRTGHPQQVAGARALDVPGDRRPGSGTAAAGRAASLRGRRGDPCLGLVGWAITCDDTEKARDEARARGFDPGDVIDGHRRTPEGSTLRWRLTSNALTAGVVPFLISWGDTPHPAASAPSGITLASFHIEHPDPPSVTARLHALGAEVEVRPAPQPALVVGLLGPNGRDEL